MTTKPLYSEKNRKVERTKYANHLADRKLKLDLDILETSEKLRMHELRTEAILLRMELRANRCREVMLSLKNEIDKDCTKADDKNEITVAGDSENASAWFKKPTILGKSFSQAIAYDIDSDDDSYSDSDTSLDLEVTHDFSKSLSIGQSVRDTQTAPNVREKPKNSAALQNRRWQTPNGVIRQWTQTRDSNNPVVNEDKKCLSKNSRKPSYLKLLQDREKFDQYTDGTMNLAMRKFEHKRRESVPTLPGHLPYRRRSCFADKTKNPRRREQKCPTDISRVSFKKKLNTDTTKQNPNFPPISRETASAKPQFCIPKDAATDRKHDDKIEIEKLLKLRKTEQMLKYQKTLQKVQSFFGGKLLQESVAPFTLTDEEQLMLEKFQHVSSDLSKKGTVTKLKEGRENGIFAT